MSEEVASEAEVAPAPELEATAAPEPVDTPEVAPKTFSQENSESGSVSVKHRRPLPLMSRQ